MKKILIIDDSTTSRLLFKAYMPKDEAYEVHEASDYHSALAKASETDPDLVVLDYNMPDYNGVETAFALRAAGSKAKLVLFTANTQQSVVDAAMAAGFVDIVEKPITAEKIKAMLERVAQ
ncbi:MAG: response regulator [Sulfuricella denitrificans]|nr:response regulator [Sulfuricella denitrificans]